MAEKIRLAFIGSGGMAHAHLDAVAPMQDADIVAFCDVDPAKAEARVAEWQEKRPGAQPKAYSDPETMLTDVAPDAAYVLLPPFAHGAAEHACLAHKVPFFVEKPIGLDMGLTREIAAEVQRTGLLTSAGYMNRYRASINRGRDLLKEDPAVLVYGGWIGGSPNPKPGDTSIGSWWVQRGKSGGQIHEQTTHTFDVVRYLCGEATEVHAYAARGFNRGLYNYDIDDASTVSIHLASGGVVNLMSACSANAGGGGVTLNVYAHDTTLLYTGWEHSVKILRKGADPEEIKGEDGIFGIEDGIFLEAVRSGSGAAIRCPYPDAARTLELTVAANRSIATGRPEPISA